MSGGQEYIPAAAILGVGNGKNAGDAGITEDNGGADAGDAGILMANRVNWTADGTFIRVDIGTPLTAALLTGKQNPRDYFARQALVNPDAPAPPASLPEGAFALEYSPSGLRALTVWPAEDYVRMIFDAESGQSAPLGIPDHWDDGFKYANTAAFAPDERKLRYGAGVFDAVTGALLYEFAEGSVSDPSAQSAIKAKDFFIWSPDGARFALRSLSGAEETAGVRDAVTGEKRFALPGGGSNSPDGPNNPVSNIVFSPDGTQIAYSDTSLRLADAGTGEIRFTLPADDGPVLSAAFSPDGGRIAYSGASIRLADTGTGKLVAETRESGAAGGELAWSPDGHILAAHDSYGRTAIFYDGALNPLFTLENQDTAPGFSFDSHFVLTGNGTVYSTENGKPLLTNTSLSAAFSPAGPRYALLLADGSVQIRELPPLSELMTRARLRLNGRVFTAKERAEYFLE
ncbi:MAG: WD40 repeat domain-containing protein [Peptococcaceae bacterium]|jgi:WD40 repeat protein|nr:WD40 repeat domain-containing protein [Peptococcaceae bacterium]